MAEGLSLALTANADMLAAWFFIVEHRSPEQCGLWSLPYPQVNPAKATMATASQNSPPPFGKYASWAAPVSIIIGILAVIGSLKAGRGDVAGTVVALVLNPIGWLAIWFWFKSTKISCPHCGSGTKITTELQSLQTGSILRCLQCRNEFRKPPMNGQQAGSVADPVRVQPVFSRPAEPIINEGAWSPNAEVLRPSVHVVEPKAPPVFASERASGDSATMLPVVATPVAPAQAQHNLIVVEAPEPEIDSEPDPVIMRVDGTSSFVTLKEHKRRGWKHAARCDLSNMIFRGVSFAGANLEAAKLDGSDFTGCDFRNSILKNTSAKDCIFEGADFCGGQLQRAQFQHSNLSKARFCTFSDGKFTAAALDDVNFDHCELSDAIFVPELPSSRQVMGGCRVTGSVFAGSNMSRCNLQGIDFHTCILTGTNLFGTSLQRCKFEGVDLSSANLINANLSQIVYSDSSRFPDGYVLPGNAQNADSVRKHDQEKAERHKHKLFVVLMGLTFLVAVVLVRIFWSSILLTAGFETLGSKVHWQPAWSVAFSPDGKRLASASIDTVKVWDIATGKKLLTCAGHTGQGQRVAFSPDGERLASINHFEKTVQLWDSRSGQGVLTLNGHTDSLMSMAFSPDGSLLAATSGYPENTVFVWDTTSGKEILALKGHTGQIRDVAFSPDGKQLASASEDNTVRLWDAVNGQAMQTFKGHTGAVMSVAFSPDRKVLASASEDGTVKVWSRNVGQQMLTLEGHKGLCFCVAFSADGKRLATTGGFFDKTVKVWDPISGQLLFKVSSHTLEFSSVAFSPNGKMLATANMDGTVKLWDFPALP